VSAGKILLVEDDADLRFAYELILKHEGYDVLVARNGKEALGVLTSHDPQLILLDIFMPIMDGRQFLEELKPSQREKYAIVVCSNTSEDEIIRMVTQLGAMEVVLKASLDPSGLLILVASYMQSRTST
jgi:CheY-like chemotaxis protein